MRANTHTNPFVSARETAEAPSRYAAAKRCYDIFFSFGGLLVLSPMFLVIAALIKLTDGGPVIYRQVRIGQHGRPFRICKFRTMISAADQAGPAITKAGDARVTWIGGLLRKTKLDEFPQLWNVLKGEMSLVGPRPEVPRYVERYTSEQRGILRLKPGITDLASLCFRDEEALLANAENVEEFYIRHCVPRKLQLNQEYAGRASLWNDTWIILQTLCPYWLGVLVTYGILLAASFWLACGLIYDFALPASSSAQYWRAMFVVVGLQLGCLMWRKQCHGMLSYFSFPELRHVATALGVAAVGLLALGTTGMGSPPRNVLLVNALGSFLLLGGFRVLLRCWRERSAGAEEPLDRPPARVGIIGAGRAGAQLALELMKNRNLGRTVVAFFDDDFQKWRKCIHDVPVVGMPECLLDGWRERLDEVFIALPGAPIARIAEVNDVVRKSGLKAYTVPAPASFWVDCPAGVS
jgi:lipopolysaccharide/colanic/teichoic acid biosynthesis glycosyltransferase